MFRAKLLGRTNVFRVALDQGCQKDIFLDFAKTFYGASHDRLLHKLSKFSADTNAFNKTVAFLTDRSQSVTCDGMTSTLTSVSSGLGLRLRSFTFL